MSIVSNLVSQSLSRRGLGQYERQAEPVIRDLEDALNGAVARLRSAGRTLGASSEQVEQALINAGLVERPRPTPPPAPAATSGVGAEAGGTLDRLLEFARQYGFRG